MMKEKEIRGVIFDIDGVLLDSMGIWKDLGARYLLRRGKEPEKDLSKVLYSMSMEQGASYLKDHYALKETEDEILDGIQNMLRDYYFYEVNAKKDALSLMKMFRDKGIRMTAATSSPREHVEKALARNGLLPYLDRIFTCTEAGASKHTPEIFIAASDFMGTEKKETCVFEDSLYALETAAKAGFHTVGVYDENGDPDQKKLKEVSGVYIRDLSELLE